MLLLEPASLMLMLGGAMQPRFWERGLTATSTGPWHPNCCLVFAGPLIAGAFRHTV
jgi:hypothetical protein